MNKEATSKFGAAGALLPLVLLMVAAFSGYTHADERAVTNDAQINQISEEVIRRLIEDGSLDEQIERGIERYIDKQRQAQSIAEEQARSRSSELAKSVRPVSPERDHIYGNPDAPVSLIEYSDFECPFCKRFHPNPKKLVDDSDGQVNWIYRHFPLEFHNPLAQLEAEASECASEQGGNDAFWQYADLIYERTSSNGNGLSPDALVPFAQEIGLDAETFEACLESGRMAARVEEDVADGVEAGVSGTPGNIIINNETGNAVPAAGALPVETLQKIVDSLI